MRATDAFSDLGDEWTVEENCRTIAMAERGDYTIHVALTEDDPGIFHVSLHHPRAPDTQGMLDLITEKRAEGRYGARKTTRRIAQSRERKLMDTLFEESNGTA